MEIINTILKWLVPFLCAGMVAFIKKQLQFNKAMKSSQLAMIRVNLANQCKKHLKEGFLDENDRYCLEELFKNYEILGGNHGMKVLVNKCYELPPSKEV